MVEKEKYLPLESNLMCEWRHVNGRCLLIQFSPENQNIENLGKLKYALPFNQNWYFWQFMNQRRCILSFKNKLLKWCYTLDLAAPSKGVLGLLKEVLYGFAGQGTSKLQGPKFFPHRWSNQRFPMTIFSRLKLIVCMKFLDF